MIQKLHKLLEYSLYATIAASCVATALKVVSRIAIPYEINAVEGRML
jgi:hypothetical protein